MPAYRQTKRTRGIRSSVRRNSRLPDDPCKVFQNEDLSVVFFMVYLRKPAFSIKTNFRIDRVAPHSHASSPDTGSRSPEADEVKGKTHGIPSGEEERRPTASRRMNTSGHPFIIPLFWSAFTSNPGLLCAGFAITHRKKRSGAVFFRSGSVRSVSPEALPAVRESSGKTVSKKRISPAWCSSSRKEVISLAPESSCGPPCTSARRARMQEDASHHLFSDFASSDPGSAATMQAPVNENPGGRDRFHRTMSSAPRDARRTSKGSASAGTPTGSSGPRLILGRGENPSESWKDMPALAPLREKIEGMAICGIKQALPLFA